MTFTRSPRSVVLCLALWALTPVLSPAASETFDPPALYLTWQRDPTTTMTVLWQTVDEAKTELYFRPAGSTNGWQAAPGKARPLPGSVRTLHAVELTGLLPRTDYEFCFWPGERAFRFRTMPRDLAQPLRFVNGGDVYHDRKWMDTMNELAGKLDPAFVVLGGDLAYSLGGTNKVENMERWDAYFDSWKQKAVTPDGRLVPMVVTIGNHEVMGSLKPPPKQGFAYYALFPFPGPQGYNALDVGNYLSLLLLDSAHTHPIEGAQSEWLEQTLAKRQAVPHLFPVYHVPAWPSYRSADASVSKMIRDLWCPLFEKYGVKVAFEHHDHTFKRTLPIRGGKMDPQGITYLGDGAWGVKMRNPALAKPRWYIAKAGMIRHLYLVTLYPKARHILAINDNGQVFDEVYQEVN